MSRSSRGGPKRSEGIPTAPPELDEAAARRAQAGRRVLLAALAAVIALGAATVFGARSAVVSARANGYELRLLYPAVTRPGLAIRWIATVRHPGGFDGPFQVATTSGYFNLFDFNNLDPTPAELTTDGSASIWTFDPPPGDTLMITLDSRLEPARQSGASAVTTVLVKGAPMVSVRYRTRVMP